MNVEVYSIYIIVYKCMFYSPYTDRLKTYESRDYKKEYSILEPIDNQGDGGVQYNLGVIYYLGKGVEINKIKS
ncbi:sel1 repeat family protein [Poseidonibacter ostreae]|uniref:Beta-lactamase n=1 Tax=Poseidonibacter ostreae TaxID=2654171 RepID=A0A6L4WU69_9BACT|nr:sel1 repeat family protein [Poseidonibacter ostreae]KAB7887612.1 hypothetical protein GBG18_13930 [Poseidonibacter ostreae]KAB7889630.1 hypothetical protein GBG19_05325 [Poseidonibacter ostreae]